MKLTPREYLAFEISKISNDQSIKDKNRIIHQIGKELAISEDECNELLHEILDIIANPGHLELYPDEYKWLLTVGDGVLNTYPSYENASKLIDSFPMFHQVGQFHFEMGNMKLIREDIFHAKQFQEMVEN